MRKVLYRIRVPMKRNRILLQSRRLIRASERQGGLWLAKAMSTGPHKKCYTVRSNISTPVMPSKWCIGDLGEALCCKKVL